MSATSLPAETTSGLLVLGATLLDVPGTGEFLQVFFCDSEQLLVPQTLSLCWRLDHPHFILQDWEQMLHLEKLRG
jgi:hypothetical protein